LRRQVLGGWSLNSIATFYAGQPLLLTSSTDRDFDGIPADQPNVVGSWYLSPSRSRQDPTLTVNSPNFGKILSAGSPRIFQPALKFLF
jgi:hypothetical protein